MASLAATAIFVAFLLLVVFALKKPSLQQTSEEPSVPHRVTSEQPTFNRVELFGDVDMHSGHSVTSTPWTM
jgi:hypothetical protein